MKKFLLLFLFCSVFYLPEFSQTWTQLSTGITTDLTVAYAQSASVGYVAGSLGKIYKTTNAGATWSQQVTGVTGGFYSICFTDDSTGYAVGDNGAALKTNDAGGTWSQMSVGTSAALRIVYFMNADTGFISGSAGSTVTSVLLKTTDAGNSWTAINMSGLSTGGIYSICFTSLTDGFASGYDGKILTTTNTGASWISMSVSSNPLGMMKFINPATGVSVGGNGTIVRTTNSGSSWVSLTSGTTNALTGLDFYDGSNGYIVGGNVGLNTYKMLKTTDGGASWTNVTLNPGTQRLERVDFFDSTIGYAAGESGTVYKWSAPQSNATSVDARFTSSEPGCLGQAENFYSVMSGTSGVTHSWNFGNGATPATSTMEDPTGIVYSTSGAKLVTHIVTSGALTDTITNIITINPSPTSSFTSTAPVCVGNAVGFTNTGSTGAGVTYAWDFGAESIPSLSTAQNPNGVAYNSSGTKTVTLTITNQFGCVTLATQPITINALPVAFAGLDTTICANTNVQLGVASIAGNTYLWFPSSTLSSSSSANPIASPIAPVTQYVLTVTNTTTMCVNQDTVNVTMLSPKIADAGMDGTICRNEHFQLGSDIIEGLSYSWSPSDSLSNPTAPNPIATPDSTTTYTVTVSGGGCPVVTDEVTVIVNQLPIVDAGVDDTITVGNTVQLIASGGVQYVWSPNYQLNNSGINNPLAKPDTTTQYIVTVTDIHGCVNVDTVIVNVIIPQFWAPTAFTPDGNGISDVFYIRGEGIQNFELSVFNRWGEQIFLSKSINIGWDGRRQSSGEELPEGAYVYHVKGTLSNGNPINSTDLINLIR